MPGWDGYLKKWRTGFVVMAFLLIVVRCLSVQWHARTESRHAGAHPAGQLLGVTKQSGDTAPRQFTTVHRRSIDVLVFGHGRRTVLVLGGIHGDEPASVELARALVRQLQALPETEIPLRVVVMPVVNPDGLAMHTRRNAHQIDVNRNFPTRDFVMGARAGRYNSGHAAASELETQAIMQVAERYRPALIMAFHAPLACINYDGPAEAIARRMAQRDHFRVVAQLQRRFPGSLGTYYGKERGVPVITLELIPGQRQWARHSRAVLEAIGITAREK